MHTFLCFTTFIRGQLPKPQFLHSFITPLWIGSSGLGVLSTQSSGPAAVSSPTLYVVTDICCECLSKKGLFFSLDGDVWRAPLIPPCLMTTPLNPTNSISPFVRDGIHKPLFEASIFQEHVHGLAVAFIWPGLGIPFFGLTFGSCTWVVSIKFLNRLLMVIDFEEKLS